MNTNTVKRGRGKSAKAADLKIEFLKAAIAHFGAGAKFKNPEMLAFGRSQKQFNKASWNWIFEKKFDCRVGRGEYRLPDLNAFTKAVAVRRTASAPVKAAAVKPKAAKTVQKVAKAPKSTKTVNAPVLSTEDEAMANKILMRLGRR